MGNLTYIRSKISWKIGEIVKKNDLGELCVKFVLMFRWSLRSCGNSE